MNTKAIISGLLATSMLVSTVAQAVPVSGAPQYTISEIQTKLDSGEFYNYPGVIREGINGVRVGPVGGKYLFGKTFEIGQALPEITDVVALQKAIRAEKKTILVASNDWVLPVPAVFVELGRQNGVDGAVFMEHYIVSTTGIDSEGFAEFAEAQTKAVIETLGIPSATIATKPLIDAGILDELAAAKLEKAALQVSLNAANAKIGELTADQVRLVSEVANLTASINSLNASIERLEAAGRVNQTTITNLTAEVAEKNARIDTLNNTINTKDTEIGTLNDTISTKDAEIDTLNGTISARDAEIDQAYETQAFQYDQIRGLRDDVATHEATIATLRSEAAFQQNLLTRHSNELNRLQGVVTEVRASLSTAIQSANRANTLTEEAFDAVSYASGYNVAYEDVGPAGVDGLVSHIEGIKAEIATLRAGINTGATAILENVRAYQGQIANIHSTGLNSNLPGFGYDSTAVEAASKNISADTSTIVSSDLNTIFVNTLSSRGGSKISTIAYDEQIETVFEDVSQVVTDNFFAEIENAISAAYEGGYSEGYEDGFADGYAEGFQDGVASVPSN